MLAAHSSPAATGSPQSPPAPPVSNWKQIVAPVAPFVEAVNQRLALQIDEFDPKLAPYAEYALTGNGKHLRPTLLALAAQALGKVEDEHVTVAVIIEMVHLATLVHDDVMDEAEIRRGQPTLAANWGNEIAVLFGDCLFAQALRLAASFPTPEICRSVAAATNTVCSGEILQTQHRRNFERSNRDYFKVLEMKTAELFALSCDLAAYLSRGRAAQRNSLRRFGLSFGTAYQIYDDCVDLFGTEAEAGKSLGTDLAKGKLTLPLLLAWQRASALDRTRLEELVMSRQPEAMAEVGGLLEQYETLAPSVEVIRRYLREAARCLEEVPDSAGRQSLAALTDFLERQTVELAR